MDFLLEDVPPVIGDGHSGAKHRKVQLNHAQGVGLCGPSPPPQKLGLETHF